MMCPHCGKTIPDGSAKCPICGNATDFARRSHYRENDSPIKFAAAAAAAGAAIPKAAPEESQAASPAESGEGKSPDRRALVIAVCALALSALCLGLSIASLSRGRALNVQAEENRADLELLSGNQAEDKIALDADISALEDEIERLEEALQKETEEASALAKDKEEAEKQIEELNTQVEDLQDRIEVLERYYRLSKSNYSLRFDLNLPGAEEDAPSPVTYKAGEEPALETPECSGYRFLGWNTQPDGSGELYTGNYTGESENLTLYAQWDLLS